MSLRRQSDVRSEHHLWRKPLSRLTSATAGRRVSRLITIMRGYGFLAAPIVVRLVEQHHIIRKLREEAATSFCLLAAA